MADEIEEKISKTGKEILDKITDEGYEAGMVVLIQSNPDAVMEEDKFFMSQFQRNITKRGLLNVIKMLVKALE